MSNYISNFREKIWGESLKRENDVLTAFKSLKKIPGGLTILSKVVSRVAPYFQTVDPIIESLDTLKCIANMKMRKSVENHIGTVHVIAICNGLEFVMGVLAEASVPTHLRWLPKGMQVNYLAKADSDIKLTATIESDWAIGDFDIKVQAHRKDGVLVVDGVIKLWVTEKK
ncbi:hotdog fold domain-containing protein [Acinetobacter gyllenbergii]|uniref:hotdog fold domain-containing protein n=1 Tax=Acinetobacter gyllenbergii TaxID=134534 RepID=UPI000806E7DE|nr:hotdog fold domain-containing protein [Acinetobacter gyllenbergii]OBY75285.1 thioesterase [Acinetobacter gyllenbergii]